jgi:hypothetical protein
MTQQRKLEYVDVPALAETFADSVKEVLFDGQSFRVELCVTRLDGPEAARRYPVTRLVLPANAALDLSTKLGQVMTAIAKQGMQQRAEAAQAKAKAEGAPAAAATPA